MEDLSSLEGPPIQDGRFTPIFSPMSPVSPENTCIAYNPLRGVPQGSVSPLTSTARSVRARSSISSIPVRSFSLLGPWIGLTKCQGSAPVPPLRNSRSHTALRDTTDIPPRPASTDNSNNTSAPFWLLVNGRLVWIEDLQLWVLWDDVVASQTLGAYYSEQQQRSQQQSQQRQSGRGIRTWKSLPPLPHEIHHLLPSPVDIGPSFDPNDRTRRRDHYFSQTSPTNARIQLQWASLAGQLGTILSHIKLIGYS